jgi:hypothetical protein
MQYTQRSRGWTCVIGALLLLSPALVPAQRSGVQPQQTSPELMRDRTAVEVVPVFGLYLPFGTLKRGNAALGETTMRQIGGALLGVRMSWHAGSGFGLDASANYSPTLIAVTDATKTVDLAGRVALFSMRARMGINKPLLRGLWSFHIASGVGAVHRHGGAWQEPADRTQFAFTIGGGARLAGKRYALNIDVEDYVTRPGFATGESGAIRKALHHEQLLSFGLGIPIGTR